MKNIHESIVDIKTIFVSICSISTLEWIENSIAAVYPVLTKLIQLVIGVLTVIYLWVRIKNARFNLTKDKNEKRD
jgi:hypothetical protein